MSLLKNFQTFQWNPDFSNLQEKTRIVKANQEMIMLSWTDPKETTIGSSYRQVEKSRARAELGLNCSLELRPFCTSTFQFVLMCSYYST